jgi:hypothetical protein
MDTGGIDRWENWQLTVENLLFKANCQDAGVILGTAFMMRFHLDLSENCGTMVAKK